MDFRIGTLADLSAILEIIESARAYLKEQGSPQWQNGYGPDEATLKGDITAGYLWVAAVEDTVVGTASLIPGIDPVYTAIADGSWTGDATGEYLSIHRFAVGGDRRGQGIGRQFLQALTEHCFEQGIGDVRIDTYPENRPMIKVILDSGFTYRGIVHFPIPDGERNAYQRLK